jgi:hypothetical protein
MVDERHFYKVFVPEDIGRHAFISEDFNLIHLKSVISQSFWLSKRSPVCGQGRVAMMGST